MHKKAPIIAIGASAGALVTLEQFFASVPADSRYIFVVIQHLSPNHKSMMDELLGRKTNLPISVISDGLELKGGHIYLNPPKCLIDIEENTFRIVKEPKEHLSYPITHFFESLSVNLREHCAAIVISGTGSDGSDGLVAVKSKGGLTIVQDREEAAFDGMPLSAIRTGMVDLVCNADKMYQACRQFFEYNQNPSSFGHNRAKARQIVQLLNEKLGYNFSGYKTSTISRRIVRRMSILGLDSMDDYYSFLANNQPGIEALSKDLMIGVTSLFRDKKAFEVLVREALPKVFEQARNTGEIRVWVTACSTGEEAYSMAILISEEIRKQQLPYGLTIFATDINGKAIKEAGNRIFSEKAMKPLDQHIVEAYFVKDNNGFRPSKKLRDLIVFSKNDILSDPPFSRIDLLSCRNLLIYLRPEIQEQLLNLFRYSLRQDGILFLGSSESVGKMEVH